MALRAKTKTPKAEVKPAPLPFPKAVWQAVRAIPRGQVRSYAQVALYAGRPGAARGVGREMATLPQRPDVPLPWWRVIRSDGTLAPQVAQEQARRLRAEGVEVAQRGDAFRVKVPREAPAVGGATKRKR
ncbi:MGMT family protein [Corallococcus macrosporus]|uniref:Methylated-DNA-[protein]-cysteine S-methyltransferase family protein n=1 Tax=Myxococcus fulvus (strain ATCC BAA-855 / HW-1) TaxID=483219 RepID=F8CGF0_MYXFH|nr:MGMT family protein [Corallococcus macrosporus]AEI68685.1 methylated-DNA-[protein]-cysteine S-methyltransferase family protein [Corallococcus macrosporus]